MSVKDYFFLPLVQTIVKAFFITILWYFFNLMLGTKETFKRFAILLFIILTGLIIINNTLEATSPPFEASLYLEEDYPNPFEEFNLDSFFGNFIISDVNYTNGAYSEITEQQRSEIIKVIDECNRRGLIYFEAAQKRCWYLPKLSDRQKTTYCFSSFMATLMTSGELKSKIIVGLLTMLTQYGCECIHEWYEIDDLLQKSKQNYECAELWQSCLNYYR